MPSSQFVVAYHSRRTLIEDSSAAPSAATLHSRLNFLSSSGRPACWANVPLNLRFRQSHSGGFLRFLERRIITLMVLQKFCMRNLSSPVPAQARVALYWPARVKRMRNELFWGRLNIASPPKMYQKVPGLSEILPDKSHSTALRIGVSISLKLVKASISESIREVHLDPLANIINKCRSIGFDAKVCFDYSYGLSGSSPIAVRGLSTAEVSSD